MKTRQPTGLPSWPILLLTGPEKTGKTYAAAAASASDLIGRTLWVGIGEDAPDEYGAIPGARFEIVEHNGTYRGIIDVLDECVTELAKDDKPGLIVLDSATRLWNMLCDDAQETANRRAREKAEKQRRPVPDEDVSIGMDLWNLAASRWASVMDCLRDHQGPSIITARLDVVTVIGADGKPTKDKDFKVQAHKSLPFDVGAIVELPEPGKAVLTGVRSLRVKDAQTARRPFPGFTVEALWTEMGLAEQVGPREHSPALTGEVDNTAAERNALLHEIGDLADKAGVSKQQIAADWHDNHPEPIAETTDLGSLELLRDDLKAKAA